MSYLIMSDTHFHGFTQFGTTNEEGVNTRNAGMIAAMVDAARLAKSQGIRALIHAGDVFHVRGLVEPSVLNPVCDAFREIVYGLEMDVYIISGNHDLEGKDASRIGSAVTALEGVGVQVIHRPEIFEIGNCCVAMIPWVHDLDTLRAEIARLNPFRKTICDLVIHAPLNGVIEGLPDKGLSTADFAGLNYRYVMAGHYHNAKRIGQFDESSPIVYSIGALTHQTWGDVGSKSGYWLVTDGGPTHYETAAPKFIDYDPDVMRTMEEITERVSGNYVRVKIEIDHESEVEAIKSALLGMGAAGVVVHPIRKSKLVARTTATVAAGASIQTSIAEWIKSKGFEDADEVQTICEDILSEVN